MNKFDTCQGCPDRTVGCHGACEGYQYREAEKPARYANRAIHAANYNTYNERKEKILKRHGIKLEGKGK